MTCSRIENEQRCEIETGLLQTAVAYSKRSCSTAMTHITLPSLQEKFSLILPRRLTLRSRRRPVCHNTNPSLMRAAQNILRAMQDVSRERPSSMRIERSPTGPADAE